MKAKDLERYTPDQIKGLVIQYWQGRKAAQKRCAELEQEIERLKRAIGHLDATIAQVRDALEGRER